MACSHTARDRERDREREMMDFYITPCTVHTTQEWGRDSKPLFSIVPFPVPVPVPFPVPYSVNKPLSSLDENINRCYFLYRL